MYVGTAAHLRPLVQRMRIDQTLVLSQPVTLAERLVDRLPAMPLHLIGQVGHLAKAPVVNGGMSRHMAS